jgi:hypothetical protein
VTPLAADPTYGRRFLNLLDHEIRARAVPVHQKGERVHLGHGFVQQLKPLRIKQNGHPAHPGDVCPRPIHAGDEAIRNWIAAGLEHNRNG